MAQNQPPGPGGPQQGQGHHEATQNRPTPPQQPHEQPSQPQPYGPPGGHSPEADARQWAMLAHVLAGVTAFLGPLIIWAAKKDEHPFAKDQVTEALNFGTTVTFAYMVVGVLSSIVSALVPQLSLLLDRVPLVVWLGAVIMGILAGLKAKDGVPHRYPFTIRLVS
jgi:uncharacterized protein